MGRGGGRTAGVLRRVLGAGCPLGCCRGCHLGQEAPWAGCRVGSSLSLQEVICLLRLLPVSDAGDRRAVGWSSRVVPAAVGSVLAKLVLCPTACPPSPGPWDLQKPTPFPIDSLVLLLFIPEPVSPRAERERRGGVRAPAYQGSARSAGVTAVLGLLKKEPKPQNEQLPVAKPS